MARVIMQTTEKQDRALEALSIDSGIDVVGYGGAKGGGKSRLARMWLAARAETYAKSTGLLIRRTYQELYRNHVRNFLLEYPYVTYKDQKHEIVFPNGSVIELGYAETESDIERYHGVEYHSVVIDQAEQNPKRLYYNLKSCMRSSIKGLVPKMLMTFNPGGIGHGWLKRMFIDRVADENEDLGRVGFVRALASDNKYINKEYIESLKTLPEQLREAYLNGSFETFEGQFFTVPAQCAEDEWYLPEDCYETLYGSLDHGISHDTSFGLSYVDKDGVMHRLFTYANNGGTAEGHAFEIKQRIESFEYTWGHMPIVVWADPSMWTKVKTNERSRSVIDEYMDVFAGTRVQFLKANNQKESGCALMRNVFAVKDGLTQWRYWRRFNIGLCDVLGSMVADKNRPEQYLKVDGDDQCVTCDTLVYTDNGKIPIIDLVDKKFNALTLLGYERCEGAKKTGTKEIYKLTFDNGDVVTCTDNHKFLNTDNKWVEAIDMLDEIGYAVDERSYDICNQLLSQKRVKSSTESDITFAKGTINGAVRQQKELGSCTETCGSGTIQKFQKGMQFITETAMSTTTQLRTFNVYQDQSTLSCTQKQESNGLLLEKKLGQQQQSGTVVKRVFSGIKSIMSDIAGTYIIQLLSKFVKYAGSSIIPQSFVKKYLNSVIPTAKLVRCVSVEKTNGVADVYCLTLPIAHNFVINSGLVVHNCDELRYGIVGMSTVVSDRKRNAIEAKKINSMMTIDNQYWRSGMVSVAVPA